MEGNGVKIQDGAVPLQFAALARDMAKRALVAAVPAPFVVVSFLGAVELVWPWESRFWRGHQAFLDLTGDWMLGSLTMLSIVSLAILIFLAAHPIIDRLERRLFPSTGMVVPTLNAKVKPPNAEKESDQRE